MKYLILILAFICMGHTLLAQSTKKGGANDSTRRGDSLAILNPTDTINLPKKKFRFKRSEFNIVVTRTFAGAAALSDSVPIVSTSSGSFAFGLGYNFNLSPKLALNIQPQYNFFRLKYKELDPTSFPVFRDTSALISVKKHLLNYIELPVSVVYTFKRDEKKSRVSYIEAGAFGGLNLRAFNKVKYTSGDTTSYGSQTYRIEKNNGLEYANPLRYGLFARVGKGFLSLQASYRLSNVFLKTRRGAPTSTGYIIDYNPKLSGLEIGISIVL